MASTPLIENPGRDLYSISHLWAVELTGDDIVDLALVAGAGCPHGTCFGVLPGNGDGTFTAPQFVDADSNNVDDSGWWLDVDRTNTHAGVNAVQPPADQDGDGDLDLVFATGNHDASIVVLRGDGTGRFDRSVLVGGGGADPDARIQPNAFGPDGHDVRTPRGVSFADTNRDGLLDIVTTLDHMSRTAPGGLVTHLADASSPVGFDAAFTPAFTSPINLDDESTALGDRDGDGHLDPVRRLTRSAPRPGHPPGTRPRPSGHG